MNRIKDLKDKAFIARLPNGEYRKVVLLTDAEEALENMQVAAIKAYARLMKDSKDFSKS